MILQSGQTIAFLGDSITEDPNGYVSIVAQMIEANLPSHGIEIVNAGRGGDKASDLLDRLPSVLEQKPDWVAVSVGINDVWHGFFDFESEGPLPSYDPDKGLPLESFAKTLDAIVGRIEMAGAKPVLFSPTVIGEQKETRENQMLQGYVAAMRDLAIKRGAHYVPMHERFWDAIEAAREPDPDATLTTDGVHMNEHGAWAMAQIVADSLGLFDGLEQ